MYTTKENIESALERKLSVDEVKYFDDVLKESIETYINGETSTIFGSDEMTEVYVSGEGYKRLVIPTMHEITSVKTDDGKVIPTSLYKTFPKEAPFLALTHKNKWSEGDDNYVITGKLGYKDIPADVIAVATEMAVSVLGGVKENGTRVKSEKVGDMTTVYAEPTTSYGSQTTLRRYARLSRGI